MCRSVTGAKASWPDNQWPAASSKASRTARSGGFYKRGRSQAASHPLLLTPKPDPEFDTKCADICAVYQAASTAAEQGVQTVSIDEMTGIQALERASPSLPMKPGHVERREFEYIRHGTKALITAFDVTSGKVRGTIGDRRTEADFVSFLETLFASAPPPTAWGGGLRQPQHAHVGRRGSPARTAPRYHR
jgi:hypothetical protein